NQSVDSQCKFWINLILTSWKTNQLGREAPGLARQTQLIAWRHAEEGWSTLNTDGSRYRSNGSTAIGGILRNARGGFDQVFCANIGNCTITRTEIRAIIEGMEMAWGWGVKKLDIQTDSMTAIATLSLEVQTIHQHFALVLEYQELKSRSWDVKLSHVFREAKQSADYLANLGHNFDFDIHFFHVIDPELDCLLRYDLIGVTVPRVTSLNN
ncbi:Putative ribonuclease H protein At1g65750, partial [Linum perenne]